MKGQEVLMSSGDQQGSYDWATPESFYDLLNEAFGPFALDAAASRKNAKCSVYFNRKDNALEQPWKGAVFCNPPYGRGIDEWIWKGFGESMQFYNDLVVMLLPARTDLKVFHDCILPCAAAVLFVRGRIQFKLPGKKNSATFPSMVVVFDKHSDHPCQFGYIMQPTLTEPGAVVSNYSPDWRR